MARRKPWRRPMEPRVIAFERDRVLNFCPDGIEYRDDGGVYLIVFTAGTVAPGSPDRYVGYRDISADPPYVLFAGPTPTRFVFEDRTRADDGFTGYSWFEDRMQKAGCKTRDMS